MAPCGHVLEEEDPGHAAGIIFLSNTWEFSQRKRGRWREDNLGYVCKPGPRRVKDANKYVDFMAILVGIISWRTRGMILMPDNFVHSFLASIFTKRCCWKRQSWENLCPGGPLPRGVNARQPHQRGRGSGAITKA